MARYQNGTLEELKTARGLCWFIRFRRSDKDRPRYEVGLKAELPTKSKASRAAQRFRDEFNSGVVTVTRRTFGAVIDEYEAKEMPTRHSTRRGYEKIHRIHIRPKWGDVPLEEVSPMLVRAWLLSLKVAPKTRGHILGQMRVLFRYAMLWEWLPAAINPMSLFSIPGTTKRTRKPQVISPEQFLALRKGQPLEIAAMLTGAYFLGLRSSELFGLRWGDFLWDDRKVWVRRAVVEGREGEVKTERSEERLPLHDAVKEAFQAWRRQAEFYRDDQFVFSSRRAKDLTLIGDPTKPRNAGGIRRDYLIPRGRALGIPFPVGWHTFRHSYKVLLERAGVDLTVQRNLMRHADIHTTAQHYGQIEDDRMQSANTKAIELVLGIDA